MIAPTPFSAIVADPIDEVAVRRSVGADESGAVVMFVGVVRDHDAGRNVRALDYRAHPDAERFLADCVAAENARTGLKLSAVHRVGELEIGDSALVVAAASAHRPEAFAAVEDLVVRIKREVPIWKRQHYSDGVSEWVGL